MYGNGVVKYIPNLIQKKEFGKAETLIQKYIRNRCSVSDSCVVRIAHNIFVDICDQLQFHEIVPESIEKECYLEYSE